MTLFAGIRKNTLNFIVDLAALLAIFAMVGTGLIMKYTLPPGSGGKGLVLWSMTRHEWGAVHFWASVALGALLIIHVALHWQWVCGTIRRFTSGPSPSRNAVKGRLDHACGVAFCLAVLAGSIAFVFVANANVVHSIAAAREHEAARAQPHGAGHAFDGSGQEPATADALPLRGSMTLTEASAQTGVPVADILAALHWPADARVDERLGRMCRAYGTDMKSARELIAARVRGPSSEPDAARPRSSDRRPRDATARQEDPDSGDAPARPRGEGVPGGGRMRNDSL
jgi:hypothetical protein